MIFAHKTKSEIHLLYQSEHNKPLKVKVASETNDCGNVNYSCYQ